MLRPALPFIRTGIIAPGLTVMQQRTVAEVMGVFNQLMFAGVRGRTNGQNLLIHQEVLGKVVCRGIVEIERQIDARSLHIDVIISGQDGE